MNEDILYQQYLSNNTDSPISIEEFTSLKSIMSPEDFDNFVGLKKKENSQETPSNSLDLGENQPTPISAQGNPQITSVPISQDLDLNQAQVEAMQGVQNPALDLQQPLVNQNGSLESNGEVNTSSSALEEFNKNIQNGISEVKDFVQDQITNPNNASLRVLPKKYENQFNNRTTATPQKEEVGNVSLPKKSRIDLTTFDTNGLQEIPIPTKSISDELGNVVAKINNDVVKAYKTPSGQTILQTGVGLIPEEVYLSLKDKEGKQRTPQSRDVYENINGVFVEQDYSEVPIDETLKQRLEPHDIENPKWINRNYGNLQGEKYVNSILQKEKEGKVKVARNEKGELIDEYLKPILDNSNVLWQPVGSYINKYNNDVNELNKEIELNNQKVSQNNSLIESQNIRDLFLGKKEEPKSPLTNLYNKIYSDTGILLTEEQKAQFNSIDDVYNFYASEKAKKEVKDNPSLNYSEEYNKLITLSNPYDILGVNNKDDISVIKKKWKELCIKYHSDKNIDKPQYVKDIYEETIKIINNAWDIISKQDKKVI